MSGATILDYYKYAVLATAAYVRTGGSTDPANFVQAASTAQANRLPLVLGQFLFDPQPERPNPDFWTVKHYYGGDVPGVQDSTGFATTLFERSGEKVLALRGTDDVFADLIRADLAGIGILGMALSQVVSMVNLVQRLKGNAGTPVLQIRVEASLSRPVGPHVVALGDTVLAPMVYLGFGIHTATGLGLIAEGEKITVTGHSLGGHLALLAGRLFPQLVNPDVYVYNAPGVDPVSASLTQPLSLLLGPPALAADLGLAALNVLPAAQRLTDELISKMGTFLAQPPAMDFAHLRIHNVESEDLAPGDDLSLVSSVFTGARVLGPEILVPTEPNSHVVEPLMDALALHTLLYSLNKNLSLADMGKLLEASSPELVRSEERLTEALFRLFLKDAKFLNDETTLRISDAVSGFKNVSWTGKGEISARAAFHDAVLRIQDAVKGRPGLLLDNLIGIPAASVANLAQGSEALGYRYALKELNPFAVVGNNAIYDQHNQKGELSLFGPANQTGALTREWIEDRAGLLQAVLAANIKDNPEIARIPGAGGISTQYHYYADGAERVLFADPVNRDPRGQQRTQVVAFADDNGRTLIGTDFLLPDRLYGGSGNDILEGKRVNDYLEGGRGDDTYVWNTGDGFDTILDVDGVGKVIVNGRAVSGGIKVAQNDYVSADKQQTLRFEGDPIAGGVLIVNGDLRIENFTSGDLGIVLNEQGNLAEIQPTTTTFQGPVQTSADFFGTDGADRFVAIVESSLFVAKGGDDLLQVSDGALGPRIAGGSGRDLLIGGGHEGVASLLGEAGQDILLGGDHPDQLVGDFFGFEFTDFDFRGSSFFYSEDPDQVPTPGGFFTSPIRGINDTNMFFAGGYFQALKYVLGIDEATDIASYYDDYLDGGGGNDFLFGNYGSDVLFGGAGDDSIDGDGIPFGLLFNLSGIRDSIWRDAVTRLFGQPGDDYLDGGAGNDRLVDQGGGNDVLIGGPGDDFVSSNDPVSSEIGYSDYLEGGEGNDRLFSLNRSLNGHNTLAGGLGDDRLTIQFGSAFFEGGLGSDNYVYFPSSANKLVIDDHDDGGSLDRLYLVPSFGSPILSSDLVPTRDEANLYLSFGGMQERITVLNWFAGSGYKIEQIVIGGFASREGSDVITPLPGAQIYDVATIESRFTSATDGADFLWGTAGDDQIVALAGNDTLTGNEGNDALDGGGGDDHLVGGIGNDILVGGAGDDTYEFRVGDGIDRISDSSGNDSIAFGPEISPADISLGLGSLLIRVGEAGDAIHIEGFDPNDVFGSQTIELFQFADGINLTYGELLARGFDLFGTAGGDVISGTNVTDRIDGLAGDDVLTGGQGSDVYFFGRGSGQDVIEDLDPEGDDVDTVLVEEGITPDDVSTSHADESIVLSINGAPDTLAIRWQPKAGYGIERVEFSDGTLWDAAALESRAIVEEAPPLASTPPDDSPGEPDLPVRPVGDNDRPMPADPPPGNGEQRAADGDSLLPPPFANRGGASLQSENSAPSVDQTEPATGASPPPPVAGGVLFPPRAGRRFREHDNSAEIEERLDALIEDWFEHPRHNAFFVGSRLRGDDVLQRDAARSNKGAQLQQTHDEIATSWHRTKAQLEAHLASSDADALGADDGVAFFPIPGGFGAIGPPPVGDRLTDIGGHQMRRLEGLREGLAILAA